MHEIHVPATNGLDALEELDRVPWDRLTHAYGRGPQGQTLDMDVEAALRAMGDEDEDTREDAWCGLLSNVWHQGTIYEATAHAVPFLAALAAGWDCPAGGVERVGYLLGIIGAAACAHGDDEARTRAAFGASRVHIEKIAKRSPSFAKLAAALIALESSQGGAEARDRIEALAREFDGRSGDED